MKKLNAIKNLPSDALYAEMPSPVGVLTMIASQKGLHAILWENERDNDTCMQHLNTLAYSKHDDLLYQTQQQLTEFFDGHRKTFDLPLVLTGTTFQLQAWHALKNIPYGKTISYGQQAESLGNRNKARAIGGANGRNPIPIIIPCHRVIGNNQHLTGFGGGLDNKARLLRLEQTLTS